MASISVVGFLPPSPSLPAGLAGASSATRWRRTVSARLAEQPDEFSPLRSCGRNCGLVLPGGEFDRRKLLLSSVGAMVGALVNAAKDGLATAAEFADMPALRGKDYGKTKMKYPDYTETQSGLQYKDLRIGTGPKPKKGETVVVDWDGYTIGYYGRIFEARNKTKGGSFEGDDKDFFKFTLGSNQVIPAFEEAISGMALGGIRRFHIFSSLAFFTATPNRSIDYRIAWELVVAVCLLGIIVPPELGYPENDYNKSGPRPTTFSGQRALDFVLKNQGLIDKTLLFDVELLKIIPN